MSRIQTMGSIAIKKGEGQFHTSNCVGQHEKIGPHRSFHTFPVPTLPKREYESPWGFPGGSVVRKPPTNVGATGDASLTPGLGRFPGGGNGNPLQYSCLGNPTDREAWWALVHGVTKSQTWQHTRVQPAWYWFSNRVIILPNPPHPSLRSVIFQHWTLAPLLLRFQ